MSQPMLITINDHTVAQHIIVREIILLADAKPVAFSAALVAELSACFTEVELRSDIGAVILSHEGRAFCAGSDLKELADCGDDRDRFAAFLAPMLALFCQIDRCGVPTIAAIDGPAVGGGFELALACDLRVMGEKAWVSLPETGFGTLPGGGGLQRLTHYIGRGRTLDLVLTGDRLTCTECVQLGLARGAAAGEVREQALALATRLARGARLAQRLAKSIIREVSEKSAAELETLALAGMLDTLTSPEGQEGLKSVAAKRTPNFVAARGQ